MSDSKPDALARLEALHAAATPGEWKLWNGFRLANAAALVAVERIGPAGDGSWSDAAHDYREPGLSAGGEDIVGRSDDFEAIVALHNAFPAMAAVVRAAREYREEQYRLDHNHFAEYGDQRARVAKALSALDAALAEFEEVGRG